MADLSRFIAPEIRTADVLVPAAGFAQLSVDDWLTDDPILVDRFVFTEDTLVDNAVDPGNHFSVLADLRMQFFQRGVQVNQQTRIPLPCHQTGVRQRVNGWPFPYDPIAAGLIGGTHDAGFLWRLPRAVRIPIDGQMYVRWENPTVARAAPYAGVTVWVTAHGQGVQSGRPAVLHVAPLYGQSPGGGGVGPMGRTSVGGAFTNEMGEEVDISEIVVHIDTRLAPVNDARIVRHMRLGLEFQPNIHQFQRNDNLAPLVAWGSDGGADGQCVIWQPRKPILWQKREITQFEFQNTSAVPTRVIVSAVGRVEPSAKRSTAFPEV